MPTISVNSVFQTYVCYIVASSIYIILLGFIAIACKTPLEEADEKQIEWECNQLWKPEYIDWDIENNLKAFAGSLCILIKSFGNFSCS